jgi:hypothetical protein
MQTRDAKGLFEPTIGTRKRDRPRKPHKPVELHRCPHCGETLTGPSPLYSCPKRPTKFEPLVDPVEYLREEMRRDAQRIKRVLRSL